MKFLLFILGLISIAYGQTIISQPYLFQKYITVKDSSNLQGRLIIPTDTTINKKGIAQIGSVVYCGNGVNWTASGGGGTGNTTSNGVVQTIPFYNGVHSLTYTNNLTIDSTTGRTYAYLYQTTGGNYKPLSTVPSSPSLGYSIYSRTNNGFTSLYGIDSLGKESRLTTTGASALNSTGSPIPQFYPVCIDSTASMAVAKGSYAKFAPFAVTQDAISAGGYGRIVYNGGTVTGMSLGAYQNGASLYLADGGGLSTTPSTSYPAVRIGIVTSNTLGNMLVAIGNVPKDSVNAATYVPYTGATTTLDMGSNAVNAASFKVNGTGGNGHVDLKWQSADAPSIANSTALYADASGNLKWKNDGNYTTTISSSANNTNVTVTAPNRNVKIDSITTSTTTAISGLLKGSSGTVGAATAGTDYQAPITLTTTGTSGAATLISNTLNIPQYTGGGGTVTSVATGFGLTGGTITTTGTLKVDSASVPTVTQTFSPIITLTDGATITWDATYGCNAKVTLGGTGRTLTISNAVAGRTYHLDVYQDGTGSRTITTYTNFISPAGVIPSLTTTASARDEICMFYDGTKFTAVWLLNCK